MVRLVGILLYAILIAPRVLATVINVPGDSATIQAGIDGAGPRDTVLIAAGVFVGDGNHTIALSGKAVHVLGSVGEDSTVIDVEGNDFGFFLNSTHEDTNSIIENITIINARRGIFLNESSPRLKTLKFAFCDNGAGSAFLEGSNSHPVISGCLFSQNDTGLVLSAGSGAVACDCRFDSNGIGIMIDFSSLDGRQITFADNATGIYSYIPSGNYGCRIDSSVFENNVTAISGDCNLRKSIIRGGASGVTLDNYWQGFSADNCLFEDIPDVVFRTGYTTAELTVSTQLAPGFAVANSIVRRCGNIALVNSEYDDAGRILSFSHCRLVGNSGGIAATGADVTLIMHRTLYAENSGTILYEPYIYGALDIVNCTIANNNADAIDLGSTTRPARVVNTIITHNIGFGIRADIDVERDSIWYCDVFGNGDGDYFGIPDQGGLNGNISADPLLLGGDPFDYHLTGQSPAIDSGDPQSPMDPNGTRADMGAYYYGPGFLRLISPESSAVIAENNPHFVWSKLGGDDTSFAFDFRLFWSIDTGFAFFDSTEIIYDTSFVFPDSLGRSLSYFWKVLGYDANDSLTVTSRIWNFYIDGYPGVPVIVAPPDSAVIDSGGFLVWLRADDPDPFDSLAYEVQIDDDSTFISPEVGQSNVGEIVGGDTIAVMLADLPGSGNLVRETGYFWRLRSTDRSGLNSPFTGANYFIFGDTINEPPAAPLSGFSPANGEEVASLTPIIHWDPAGDPDDPPQSLSYIIELSSDSAFEVLIFSDTTATGVIEIQVQPELFDNSLYFYRVMTFDDGGARSSWSAIQSFWTNLVNLPPEPFLIFAPPPNIKHVEYFIAFNWGQSADYDPHAYYVFELQLSADSSFSNFAGFPNALDTTFVSPTDSLASMGPSLFWRVIAIDDDSMTTVGGMPPEFRLLTIIPPGDANASGAVNGLDVIFLVNYFKGYGPAPEPFLAGDANASCSLTGQDVVYLVNFLKGMGPSPMRPDCGLSGSFSGSQTVDE